MSLSSALSSALSGLQASTLATQIASNNISNAQTAGYTEKSVQVEASAGTGGVEVVGYNRVSDSVLSATLNGATSSASLLSTQNGYMQQIQSMLGSSSSNPALSSAVSNFQSAWTQFSAAPEDPTQKQAVVSAGQQLASTITSLSSQISTLQSQAQSDLSTNVTSLNVDLTNIQSLNNQISSALANNQPAVNLQDQRDQAINAVAAIVGVQVMPRANGQVALYTPGGAALVDGQAQNFTVSGNTVLNAAGADASSILTGGSLQAQLGILSTASSFSPGQSTISNLKSQLENFANMFVSTAPGGFADTYNSATTGTGELASGFFTATTGSDGLPDLSTFAVNTSLVNGTATVKQASAVSIAATFAANNLAIDATNNVTTGTFSANGLNVNNQTYAGIATSILSGLQQQANTLQSSSQAATAQQAYYKSTLSNATGVNIDAELVNLTNLQNAYAASAHVITTIQSMLTTLEGMVQ